MTRIQPSPDEPVTQRIERALDRREIAHDRRVGDKFFSILQQLLIPIILGLISCLGGIIMLVLGMREDISILRHDHQNLQNSMLNFQTENRDMQKDVIAIDKRMIQIEQQNRTNPSGK